MSRGSIPYPIYTTPFIWGVLIAADIAAGLRSNTFLPALIVATGATTLPIASFFSKHRVQGNRVLDEGQAFVERCSNRSLLRSQPLTAGLYTEITATITSAWPFPWRAKRRIVFDDAPLAVAPTPALVGVLLFNDSAEPDESALRKWAPGEPTHHMAWKATARRGDGELIMRDVVAHPSPALLIAEGGYAGAARTLRTMLDVLAEGRKVIAILPSGAKAYITDEKGAKRLSAELVGETAEA